MSQVRVEHGQAVVCQGAHLLLQVLDVALRVARQSPAPGCRDKDGEGEREKRKKKARSSQTLSNVSTHVS